MNKEIEPKLQRESVNSPEQIAPVEQVKKVEDNLEVASWIEKIEKRFSKTPSQPADQTDDIAAPPQPTVQQPPVTLPVTKTQVHTGKKASIDLGIAWLVTWAIRQMKLFARSGRKVLFRENTENK